MKNRLKHLCLSLSVVASFSQGEDLTTTDGKQYKNIKVTGDKPDSVKLMHDGGVSMIPKKDLPLEFISLHELSAPVMVAEAPEVVEKKRLLAGFVATTPTFATKDGRTFQSSQIKAIEPNGLNILADSGPIRVKFTDLPLNIREAFHFDAGSAARFEREQTEAVKNAAALRQEMANAASVVDGRLSHGKLTLLQNIGKGWRCHLQLMKDMDEEVVTAHQKSSLDDKRTFTDTRQLHHGPIDLRDSNKNPRGDHYSEIYSLHTASKPTFDYEKSTVQKAKVVSDEGEVMVFDLPAYDLRDATLQDKLRKRELVVETPVFYVGHFRTGQLVLNNNSNQVPEIVQAYVTNHAKAIKLVATHGLDHPFDKNGEP